MAEEIPSSIRWVKLPGFGLEVSIPAEELREFVKSMFRVVARAMFDVFPHSSSEIQYVFLCKVSVLETGTKFQVWAPFERLIDVILAKTPPRITMEEAKAYFERVELDIHHQYLLVPGSLAPITVLFNPAARKVTFTNKAQMERPEKFLVPKLSSSTSGFLNFVGTLEMKRLGGDARQQGMMVFDGLQDSYSNLSQTGLKQWLRWVRHITEAALWETDRIFINVANPEQYVYQYGAE